MQQGGYKGNYYRGINIGSRQYKQKIVRQFNENTKKEKSNFGFYMIIIGLITLCILIYFNKKETTKKERNNINDTVELIEKVANYNLETDLAEQQSVHSAQQASINFYNPAQQEEINRQKRVAYLAEKTTR